MNVRASGEHILSQGHPKPATGTRIDNSTTELSGEFLSFPLLLSRRSAGWALHCGGRCQRPDRCKLRRPRFSSEPTQAASATILTYLVQSIHGRKANVSGLKTHNDRSGKATFNSAITLTSAGFRHTSTSACRSGGLMM